MKRLVIENELELLVLQDILAEYPKMIDELYNCKMSPVSNQIINEINLKIKKVIMNKTY